MWTWNVWYHEKNVLLKGSKIQLLRNFFFFLPSPIIFFHFSWQTKVWWYLSSHMNKCSVGLSILTSVWSVLFFIWRIFAQKKIATTHKKCFGIFWMLYFEKSPRLCLVAITHNDYALVGIWGINIDCMYQMKREQNSCHYISLQTIDQHIKSNEFEINFTGHLPSNINTPSII